MDFHLRLMGVVVPPPFSRWAETRNVQHGVFRETGVKLTRPPEVVHRIEFQLPSLRKETGPGLPGEIVEGAEIGWFFVGKEGFFG